MKRMRKASPVSRLDWHKFYVARFNKTQAPQAEHLAVWFLILHLAFDQGE